MKRGFLFGLGWFLIILVIGMFGHALSGSNVERVTNAIVALICMPLSVVLIRAAKRAPPHRSRLHAFVGWLLGFFTIDAGVLAVVAAVALWGSGWNPFVPKDYEECVESAARSAKSKEALAILASSCSSKFAGRRNSHGGYTYYDSRQDQHFDITGPNPSPQEWKSIEWAHSAYLDARAEQERRQAEKERQAILAQAELETRRQQAQVESERRKQIALAEIERRRQIAVSNVEVMTTSIECVFGPSTCGIYKLNVRIKNKSKENIAALSFGWAFVSLQDPTCPNSLPTRKQERVILRPGDTTVLNIDGHDGPGSTPVRYCINVSDVQIGP